VFEARNIEKIAIGILFKGDPESTKISIIPSALEQP
jgi:hypothetical protein